MLSAIAPPWSRPVAASVRFQRWELPAPSVAVPGLFVALGLLWLLWSVLRGWAGPSAVSSVLPPHVAWWTPLRPPHVVSPTA
uniref:Uncharacterized protein n=1 Tax=Arundo donax TaxID=35708 RepID=A0A0A8YNP6_ARUDO